MLQSVQGIGAIAGSLIVASAAARRRGRMMILWGGLLGVSVAVFAVSTNYWITMGIMMVVGVAQAGRQAIGQVLIQTYAEDEFRGRVTAVWFMQFSLVQFGTFLAPHHPVGENPMLQFQSDLDFAAHLDRLGFDEFWCGEHHSSGWEMIASPEMFLAAAGQRTHTIRLGTGVISLPYHHPFNVAQRIVQLDHMTKGRAM